MRCERLTLCLTLSILLVPATAANAQIISTSPTLRTAIAPAPDSIITVLTRRIEALESIVAQLQQKVAFIKSVSPLMLDVGSDAVTIRAGQISFDAFTGFSVRAGNNLDLNSGTNLTLKAGNIATIRSSAAMMVEAGAVLDVKGSTVRLNGGSTPIACAGAALNLQTAPGGALRGEHIHALAVPVGPCTATVLVPGPGQ